MRYRFLPILAAPLLLANADASAIPPAVRAMLDAALASGNEGEVATVAKYARAAAPESATAIAALVDGWKEERRSRAEKRLRDASFVELVKGRVELGGYVTTGNSEDIGLTAALDLKREGLQWRHKLLLRADYQESWGRKSREHYLAAYEPNWKVGERAYVYGAAQFESDRFLGFDDRYSLSAGAGYSAIKEPGISLDLELGPAWRHTEFTDSTTEASLAARGSLDFDWKLTPAITLRQDASAYLQEFNSTVSSKTALAAKLFGPFSAQLSYAVQHESMPPLGRRKTDTTSRASLVVDF